MSTDEQTTRANENVRGLPRLRTAQKDRSSKFRTPHQGEQIFRSDVNLLETPVTTAELNKDLSRLMGHESLDLFGLACLERVPASLSGSMRLNSVGILDENIIELAKVEHLQQVFRTVCGTGNDGSKSNMH